MIDAFTAADAILMNHFWCGYDTDVVPVQHGAYSEDVRAFEGMYMEKVLREVECHCTVKVRGVLQDEW